MSTPSEKAERERRQNVLQTIPVVQHLLQEHVGIDFKADRTTESIAIQRMCGGHTTVNGHINQGILLLLQFGYFCY